MENIIDPISPQLLLAELKKATFIRQTSKAKNDIYITDALTTPLLMREIARLREISFRQGGGGSGKSFDMDSKDIIDNGYKQLIVWNPDANEIIGGYRYILGGNVKMDAEGQPIMAMGHIFIFSETFINDYLPNTLELGRAFVQPKYQSIAGGLKALYSLDNLWDGIGAIVAANQQLKYLIGKVTIYSKTPVLARNAIVYYMRHYFENDKSLLIPKKREEVTLAQKKEYISSMCGDDYKKDFKWLNTFVKQQKGAIPPLFQAYIALSNTLTSFGTVFDPDFGDIYDTGIMLTIQDIYEVKMQRYIGTYLNKIGADIKRNFV